MGQLCSNIRSVIVNDSLGVSQEVSSIAPSTLSSTSTNATSPIQKPTWKNIFFRILYMSIYLLFCVVLDQIHELFKATSSISTSAQTVKYKHPQANIPTVLQQTLASSSSKFDKRTQLPFFWHIPKSGGTSIKNMYSQCYGIVEASETGVAHGHHLDSKLKIVQVEQGRYVNVDVSTDFGIERAASLHLIESNLADIIVSPLLYKSASTLFYRQKSKQAKLFMIWREPVERIVSLFYYLKTATWEPTYNPILANMTLQQYAFSQFCESNFVARSLVDKMESALDKQDVQTAMAILKDKVIHGFLTDLPESVKRFDSIFGFNTVYQTCKEMYILKGVNRQQNKHTMPQLNRMLNNAAETVALEEIKRKNWLDIRLYNYAQDLYREQQNLVSSNNNNR